MTRGECISHRHAPAALAAALGLAVTCSAAASPARASRDVTVRCTETLIGPDVTDGSVAGTGRCTLTGAIDDRGKVTDYRTEVGNTALIRRVVVGRKGTITFLITIDLVTGAEPWSVRSGSRLYRGLHGKGRQVVDDFSSTPATFVMKGTVSR
jgi:hypothetical protein